MPALRGSLTYARFFVEGAVPEDFRERWIRTIRARAMRPLEPEDEDLERSGWAKLGEPFVTELRADDVFHETQIVLGFRTDRWTIPGPVLRTRVREAEAAYLEKKGRERLSKKEKQELKLLVTKKLRRNMAPSTRAVDLAWSLEEGIVRFFSHAQKPGALMNELFEKTFSLRLVPESPYSLAARLGLSKAEEKAWEDLEPTYLGTERSLLDEAAEEEE